MPKKKMTGRPVRMRRAVAPKRRTPLAGLSNAERRSAAMAKLRAAIATRKETA